jgi:CheY-like chemotaxis protein
MIIFVDDDKRYIESYIEELRDIEYEVKHECDVDNAFKYLLEKYQKKEIDLLILDMMMPPGEQFEDSDDDGRRTGISLIHKLEKRLGKIDFPLIIFTNVNIDSIDRKYQSYVLQKEHYTSREFADEIRNILDQINNQV